MQTSNRLFDDIAKVASGAMNTLGGLREEVETRVRERLERVLADMDLVTREEFDAARAMAVKARTGQEELAERLARVEAELAGVKAAGGAGGSAPVDLVAPAAVGGTGPLVVGDIGAAEGGPAAAAPVDAAVAPVGPAPETLPEAAPETAAAAPTASAAPAEDGGIVSGEPGGSDAPAGTADERRDGGVAP